MKTFQKITLALLTTLAMNTQLSAADPNTATSLYIDVADSESAEVSGALSATTAYKRENGTAVLSGANTFTALEIQDGTISVNATACLGDAITPNVILNGASNPTLQITSSMNTGRLILTLAGTLTVDNGVTATLSANTTGPAPLTKAGTGILDIAADRSGSTAPITVSAGTLRIGGSLGQTPNAPISVDNGGIMLLHTGIVSNAVRGNTSVASGGILQVAANTTVPAANAGTDLFNGTLTMSSGSILKLGNGSTWARDLTVGIAL